VETLAGFLTKAGATGASLARKSYQNVTAPTISFGAHNGNIRRWRLANVSRLGDSDGV
jgi:hypothetical protein